MAILRYRYQTIEFGEHDIHFRSLRDRQQYEDDLGQAELIGISSANWPIAGMVWPSEEVLAQLMTAYNIENKRVLEIGCGIGLASLVLNERQADITATDIHPSSGDNLQHNTQLNNGRHIPFLRTAWEDTPDSQLGSFDLIIGSDLLYEPLHAKMLAMFVQQTAKPRCEVVLVDAGRGHCPKFRFRMQEMGFNCEKMDSILPQTGSDKYKGKIFRFQRNYA
ncbi:MAG: methyltransferase domain-containing protein [Gammaproteobacteria bacterium]|nr:methyltransferase domain-containing protein [Gammaproteobacteria bacterium]